MTCKWVLKRKLDERGKTIKLKARLVVRGFEQVKGLDYTDIWASTSLPPTWRLILAFAAVNNWEIQQIDFIGAFLNGEVKEDIYLEPPEGLQLLLDKDPMLAKLMAKLGWSATEDLVLQLEKALYGLKQSPCVWQQKVASLLLKLGYNPLISDSATYCNSSTGLFVITYIDDCLIIGPSSSAINRLKALISKVYEIEDRGDATLFLGIEIVRDRAKRLLWIHQKHYIQTAVKHFGLEDAKTVRIPL